MAIMTFPSAHAWKTTAGVVAYEDAARAVVLKAWRYWASDVPSMRQRYVTINQTTYRILWHR